MGTNALVIVPDNDQPKSPVSAIVVHGDGYPEDLGMDLIVHIGDLEKAQKLIQGGNLSYFDPQNWELASKGDHRPNRSLRWGGDRLKNLMGNVNYVYRIHPRTGVWYLWIHNTGWAKLIDLKKNIFRD